jgi:ligand-binding sensor domain-containing protein
VAFVGCGPGSRLAASACLVLAVWLAAPCHALPADRSLQQYVHDSWRSREGLGGGPVEVALQTRDGELWLGTHQGLVRFDGFQFTRFSSANEPALRHDMILKLLEGRDGTLWIGTQSNLIRYRRPKTGDPGGFSVHGRAGAAIRGMVQALQEDAEGRLWIGTDSALLRDDGQRLTVFTTADGLPGERVLSLAPAAAGGLWVGTSGGLVHWQGDRPVAVWRSGQGLPEANIRALATTVHNGRETVWAGTFAGLVRLDEGKVTALYTQADGLPNDVVRALHLARDGSLWIGTNSGLARWRPGAGRLEQMAATDGLSAAMVLSLAGDRSGNLWIGTSRGLDRLREGQITVYGTPEGLPVTQVWAVHEDPQGRLWVGGNHGGATALSSTGLERLEPSPHGLRSEAVYTVASTPGTLWFGGDRGLSRLRGGVWQSWTSRDGLPSDAVLALLAGRDGTLWIGTHQGLVRWRDGPERVYDRSAGLGANVARTLLEDRRGDLWTGTNGGGVSRLRRAAEGRPETLETWTTDDGLSGNLVLSLLEDADGTIWVGTDGDGLNRWDDGRWTVFGAAQGLIDDKINQILDDGRGFLWWNGANGIYRVAKADLAAVAAGKRPQVAPMAFDERDGLRTPQSDGGVQSTGCRRRDGTLWWATLDGVARIDPARIDAAPPPPATRLLEAVIDGTAVRIAGLAGKVLRLPPDTVQIELRYGALDLNTAPRVRFRSRLNGLDTHWIDAGERRSAFYTRLAPGRYRFEVEARRLPGAWNPKPAQIEIVVEPHFFQRWSFYGILLAGAALGFGGWHRRRIWLHQRREQELERRVAEAVAQVKVLSGLLPMCMSCKKIRDDEGYWNQLETYLSEHTEAVLSHGLCPECFADVTRWRSPES